MDFGIRVGMVVERNGALLLVRHEKPGREPYWVLPGGRLEPGESIPYCAERELLEETSLEGRFADVLYVSEFFAEDRHTVDITARVEVDGGGEARLGSDPEVEEKSSEPTLKGLCWIEAGELEEIPLLPDWIKAKLLEVAGRGWPAGEVYLGDGNDIR
jgi:ADP-ribose pyrophosphatase YjhB (NUDIX family)